MKSISKILVAITLLLSIIACNAQIKNAKIETVHIYGNCEMCKSTIEKAANLKKLANISWNKDTKMATISYDSIKTNQNQILKRIALAGYDSDKFLAPDNAYAKLASCCQYERAKKTAVKTVVKIEEPKMPVVTQEINQLNAVFDTYFVLKDALVQTDGANASTKSALLLTAIKAVKMENLSSNVHTVWMKVMNELLADAGRITNSKQVSQQRNQFMNLSKNMYGLMKVSKTQTPTYYQFCPMANNGKGANWLSKETAIKNPYYGSEMLSCGKTVETIK